MQFKRIRLPGVKVGVRDRWGEVEFKIEQIKGFHVFSILETPAANWLPLWSFPDKESIEDIRDMLTMYLKEIS